MLYLMYIVNEFLSAAVILIPTVLIIWGVCRHDWKRAGIYCVFTVYLAAIYFLVGLPTLPSAKYMGFYPNVNLIPFLEFLEDFRNTALNTALFVPLGFLLPLFWKNYRKWTKTVCTGLCISLTIELIQLFNGRATDINDVITNVLGTALGYLLVMPLLHLVRPCGRKGEEYTLLALTAAVMFFVQPYLVNLL